MSTYTPWQRQCRRRVQKKHERIWLNAMDRDGDSDIYSVLRIEWRKSSYMVIFNYHGYERSVNIIHSARERFGRLTQKTREKIEKAMPSTLTIQTCVHEYYIPGIPGNVMQPRTLYNISSSDLDSWFDSV